MNILVSGGAGYIGSHTCIVLLEAGHDVIIADNLSNSKIKNIDRIEEITGRKVLCTLLDPRPLKKHSTRGEIFTG